LSETRKSTMCANYVPTNRYLIDTEYLPCTQKLTDIHISGTKQKRKKRKK